MPTGALISAGGAIGGGLLQGLGSFFGAGQQVKSQQNALNMQQQMFQTALGQTQPFIDAGKGAAGTLSQLLTPGPNQTAMLNQLPGYQFIQDWGQKAVQNIGSTLGFGGNTLAAGAQYATGQAQQSFGTLANLLQGLTNTGAGAANSLFSGAANFGNIMGNTQTNLGNALGAQIAGPANAVGNAFAGAGNAGANAYILNKLFNNNSQNLNPGIYSSGTTGGTGGQLGGLY